jgi:hypothetical protein
MTGVLEFTAQFGTEERCIEHWPRFVGPEVVYSGCGGRLNALPEARRGSRSKVAHEPSGADVGSRTRGVEFARDSPLEEGVSSEPVSESPKIPLLAAN